MRTTCVSIPSTVIWTKSATYCSSQIDTLSAPLGGRMQSNMPHPPGRRQTPVLRVRGFPKCCRDVTGGPRSPGSSYWMLRLTRWTAPEELPRMRAEAFDACDKDSK